MHDLTSQSNPCFASEGPGDQVSPILPAGTSLRLSIQGFSAYHFVLCACQPVQSVLIDYSGPKALENVTLRLTAGPEIYAPWETTFDILEPGVHTIPVSMAPDKAALAALTEDTYVAVEAGLYLDGALAAVQVLDVNALAFDHYPGTDYPPECLASFALPGHKVITELLAQAGGNFDSYATQDPARILEQAKVIFETIGAQNWASAEQSPLESTQPLRLCDQVAAEGRAASLELSLVYAACLEAAGLHPLLLLQEKHAFVGLWLEAVCFPEAVQTDPAQIAKRQAAGVDELTVIDIARGGTFEDAVQAGQALVGEDLQYIIDIARARLAGICPLPLAQDSHTLEPDRGTRTGALSMAAQDRFSAQAEEKLPKMVQWERKLLDLGLRNTLINMRLSRSIIPILADSLTQLEDALSDGREYVIGPRPQEWRQDTGEALTFENFHKLDQYRELIQSEFKNKRLRSPLTETELSRAILQLYRSAKTALEENGANTLYLALGLMRWYETPASRKPRYAPLVLLPVELVRKSAAKGYVIRLRDEDPQMNITLLEMLKQDFGIRITGLDPLPQDEHGIDLQGVFTTLRRGIMNESRWDILESAYLGLFSFSQFVMWNDLRNRSEDLQKNKIVRSLMDGRLAWEPEAMEIGSSVPEDGVYLPLPADASQLYAIEAASQGKSFVLHGPPGTGKSQTITALIANALAQGKTVLFVAEKMAALSVVYNRLGKLGLSPFCLELHSNKSKKRDILDQLQAATEVTRNVTAQRYQEKAEEASHLRRELDAYAKALHKAQPCGMSLFALVDEYEKYKGEEDLIYFSPDFAKKLSGTDLAQVFTLTERLVAAGRAVGHPHNHSLTPVRRTQYTQTLRAQVASAITPVEASLSAARDAAGKLRAALGRTGPGTQEDLTYLYELSQALLSWKNLPRAWAQEEDLQEYLGNLTDLCSHAQGAGEIREKLLSHWQAAFLQEDGLALKRELDAAEGKWFLAKAMGKSSLAKRLAPLSRGPLDKNALAGYLDQLTAYQEEAGLAQDLLPRCAPALENLCQNGDADWKKIAALAAQAGPLASRMDTLAGTSSFRVRFAGDPSLLPSAEGYAAAWEKFLAAYGPLNELLSLTFPTGDFLAQTGELCAALRENSAQLREWTAWQAVSQEASAQGLGPVAACYESGAEHSRVLPMCRKALYQALVAGAIDESDILSTFSGAVFSEIIQQFKRVDGELQALAAQEIFCRLAAKVPDFTKEAAQSSELGILKRAIRSGGRGISIRRLFEQLPGLLPRLCPCMLMSPISAAQYLDPRRTPFDLVVFDEASQLPTCKAVGALARGKEAVIVGDPKQMPPTSFFSTNTVDEENLEAEDLESILDDCLALNMPETHLLWHYRSRHESLIAFSNRKFYENKLYTFPSVSDRDTRVRLVPVEGFFDRGKTRQNRAEAEAILAELTRRYQDPALRDQSVGVVTFNINQQNLIDDLLTEACAKDPALDAWANQSAEPLFIKNLENVQGDERDVILFSVGYGPDQEGKLYMNFGPLNRDGGWRRLNVAVSRARQEMVVFSTLAPEQIDLTRSSAEGVAALRDFLAYAKSGTLPPAPAGRRNEPEAQEISLEIAAALQEKGYETETMVGHSAYRVDLGVVDPENPGKYLLGVVLDGPAYGAAKTARDRELGQLSVLRGLGWKLHRVWTMDWWDNSEKELAALFAALDEAKKAEPAEEPPAPSTPAAEAPQIDPAAQKAQAEPAVASAPEDQAYIVTKLAPRVLTAEEYVLPGNKNDLKKRFLTVLQQEVPIVESLLTKRVLQSCGLSRAGARIQAWNREILESLDLPRTQEGEAQVFWAQGQDPDAYGAFRTSGSDENHREAREIPLREIANGACRVLSEQIALPREDLIRETGKRLGFPRATANVAEAMAAGVAFAISQGRIREDTNGSLTLAN